jgi:hypothetical protein
MLKIGVGVLDIDDSDILVCGVLARNILISDILVFGQFSLAPCKVFLVNQ